MDLVMIIGGLVLLVLAGDALVRGAVSASVSMGVPAFIVSLVVIGFGTSAPELLISVQSALSGVPGLAIGNVVGSNIANILLVLGVTVSISALVSHEINSRKPYLQMLLATLVFIALCFMGPLHYWHGFVLLALLGHMLWSAMREVKNHRASCSDDEVLEEPMATWKTTAYLIGGIVGLPLGAQFMVDGAQGIARDFGISEEVIGLTLVAIGTSLPELVTAAIAALKNKPEVALGNVLGSNLFNILAIMGVTAFLGPIPIGEHMLHADLWVMLAAALAIMPFALFKHRMPRFVGVAFLVIYCGYMISLF